MNIIKKIDYLIRKNKILRVRDHTHDLIMCGNSYGGFMVALKQINAESIVYSLGIGEDLSFSEKIIADTNCSVFAFDPTPKSIKYVEESEIYKNPCFKFYAWGVSDFDGVSQFHLPQNEEHVSGSIEKWGGVKEKSIEVNVKSLKTIMTELGHKKIDLLKMDIEGTEFKVIEDITKNNIDVKQICLEFHDRFFGDGIEKMEKMMDSLKKSNFELLYYDKKGCLLTLVKIY